MYTKLWHKIYVVVGQWTHTQLFLSVMSSEESIAGPGSLEAQCVNPIRVSPQGAVFSFSHLTRRPVQSSENVKASLNRLHLLALGPQGEVCSITFSLFLDGSVVVLEDFELIIAQIDLEDKSG